MAQPVVMDDYNPDWDTLYPFSAVSYVLASFVALVMYSLNA
jgi:hypothetical protein